MANLANARSAFSFDPPASQRRLLEIGEMPLPPYIERKPDASDSERYQTVFAKQSGSVAAPTAGLHFTPQILEECRAAGAKVAEVTLHVGLGTFAPLRAVQLSEVQLHEERFEISEAAAQTMREASRIFCVGTTSVTNPGNRDVTRRTDADERTHEYFYFPGFPISVPPARCSPTSICPNRAC